MAKFWDEVLDRMIEPRPADRPGSAAEVAAMFPGSVAEAAVASTDDARQRVAAQVEASGLIQEEAARSVDVMHQTEQPRLQRAALLQSTRVAEMQDLATRQAQQAAAESKRAALEQIQRNSAELEKQIPNRKANVTRIPERQLSSSSAYSSDEGATKTYPLRRIAWIVAVLSLIAFFATCGLMNSFGAQDALVYIVAHSLPLVVSGRMYDNSFRWGISSLLASFFLSWPGFCIVYVFHWLSDSSIDSRL